MTLDPSLPSLLPDERYFCSFTTSNGPPVLSIITEEVDDIYTCSVEQIVDGMADIKLSKDESTLMICQ